MDCRGNNKHTLNLISVMECLSLVENRKFYSNSVCQEVRRGRMKYPKLSYPKKEELVSRSEAPHSSVPDVFEFWWIYPFFTVASCPRAWEAKKMRRVVKKTLDEQMLLIPSVF